MKAQRKLNLRQNIWRLCHCMGTLLLMIWLPAATKAAPGNLDLSFGNGGIVVTQITNPPYYDWPNSMQLQPDGKIVVCGQVYEDDGYGTERPVSFFLARYNPTGTLDTSFGANGKVIAPINSGGEFVGEDIALQPDGKIIAVGFNWNNTLVFAINRYNSDGTLDTSFGTGGKVTTPVTGLFGIGNRIKVQPDGKIVVAGYSHLGGDNFAFAVVRYHSNGSLDTSFGVGGEVFTPINNNYVWVGTVLLQPDGKIIIVGGSGIILVRYNADGSLDSDFGSNGKVTHLIFGLATFHDGVLQPDGKIVAAGKSNGNTAIVRYNANGSIDTSFATNGMFTTGYNFYAGNSVALQPDGKIVAFGYAHNTGFTSTGFAVARLHPNGSPDGSFGTDGRLITPIGTNNDSVAVAGALQPDGKILAFGRSYPPIDDHITVIRYLGDSATSRPTKFDFDGDGKADVSVFRPSDRVWYLNRSSQGFSALQFGLSNDKITPADFDGDGRNDIAVFRNGVWYLLRSTQGFLAVQFGLADDIPVPADFDGDGRAELAVYRGGAWYTLNLQNNQTGAVQFGLSTDKTVVGDYDGDTRADYAVYRDGFWYLLQSTQGFAAIQFGLSTDKLVPADYDGDGKTDVAVYRNGTWFSQRSLQGFTAFQFGISTDIPAPADYDGDGKADAAVYRNGNWYLLQSTNGFSATQFGLTGDKPVPSAYLP